MASTVDVAYREVSSVNLSLTRNARGGARMPGHRRAWWVSLLLFSVVLLVSSCGADDDAGPATDGTTSPAPVEEPAVSSDDEAPTDTSVEEPEAAPDDPAEDEAAVSTDDEESMAGSDTDATTDTSVEEPEAAPDDAAEDEAEYSEPVELDKVVATHHFTSLLAMPTQFGMEKGFFERNGIDLELISVPAGQTSIATLISGDAHVAHQGTTSFMALRANQDQPMQVLGSMFESLGNVLLIRPGLDIPNKGKYPEVMHDLVGLNIGVSSLGGQQQLTFDVLLQSAGLPSDAVNYVSAGYTTSTVIPALQRGDADIVITIEPVSTIATSGAAGEVFEVALDLRKGQGPPQFVGWIQNCYGSLEDILNERPDVYRRFDQTIQEVKAYMADTANRDEVVEWLAGAMDVESEVAAALYDNNMFGFSTGGFTEEGIAKISETHVFTGLLDRPVTYDELVWQPPS